MAIDNVIKMSQSHLRRNRAATVALNQDLFHEGLRITDVSVKNYLFLKEIFIKYVNEPGFLSEELNFNEFILNLFTFN